MRGRMSRSRPRSPTRCAAAGYEVWRDDELPAHRAYADVIEERHQGRQRGGRAVVGRSGEIAMGAGRGGHRARRRLTLIQATLDGDHPADAVQPDPVRRPERLGRRARRGRLAQAAGQRRRARRPARREGKRRARSSRDVSICVLPFQNMSGDAEQEYFSDGISEDITTDLSQGLGARGDRPQHRLHLQGPVGRRVRRRPQARRQPRARRQRPQGRRPGPDHRPADRRRDRRPRLGRPLRPRPRRHLRHPGRDFEGDRQGAEAEAAAGGEEGDRAARHDQCRGLQSLSDGAAILDHRQSRRPRGARSA